MSYINMALGSLIPMFYTPVMLNLLGQSEYGLFKLASTVTSYLGLISFGIGSAVVRYLVKYRAEGDKDGEERMFGLFNIIFLVISAITLVVGVVIAFNVGLIYGQSLSNEQLFEMTILVLILTINTAISFSATPYTAVVTCHERFIFLQIINIITTVLTPIANLFVLFLGFSVYYLREIINWYKTKIQEYAYISREGTLGFFFLDFCQQCCQSTI